MSLKVRNPLPPGSYAYCEPACGWRDESPAAEANALLHSQTFQHVVHVYVPSCGDVHVEGDEVYACEDETGHPGRYHRGGGRIWPTELLIED